MEQVNFNETKDTLFFVGDLVNRGDKSLEVLKFIYNLPNKKVVLGNHDIALLEMYYKLRKPNKLLVPILKDKMADELMQWLRKQPVFIEEENFCFCHAGMYPKWSIKDAVKNSKKIENILQSDKIKDFLDFKNNSFEKERDILFKFILMRFLDKKMNLVLEEKRNPKNVKNLTPWFEFLPKQPKSIIFGHWASLGFYENENVKCIDDGFIWGGKMVVLSV